MRPTGSSYASRNYDVGPRVRRTGIDLSATWCSVIDAESPGRRRKGEPCAFRVHSVASIAHGGDTQALTAELKTLAERNEIALAPIQADELGIPLEAVTPQGMLRTLPFHASGMDGFFAARLVLQ